jgi:hypothetical protein
MPRAIKTAVIVHRSINWSIASLESVDIDTLLTKRANLVTKEAFHGRAFDL